MKSVNNHISYPANFLCKSILSIILLVGLLQQCTREKDTDLPEPLSIELIAHGVTTFRGTDGSIEIEVTGGAPPYNYNWSNGETTKDIEGLSAGIYSVIVKDAVDSAATGSVKINQPIPENAIMDIEENIYTTIKIGEQTWMQENLRVSVAPDSSEITSYIYNDEAANEETFGRLYTWDVAMNGSTAEKAQGICPAGWHIPSDGEWKTLEMNLGMTQLEADMSNTWRGQGVGTKLGKGGESGYEALYAGRRLSSGTYSLLNQYEYVWTSTESGEDAWRRCLEAGVSTVGRWNTFPKSYAFSIRCIKDN
jgi:uncharacterized protein (TIGR02145 family)